MKVSIDSLKVTSYKNSMKQGRFSLLIIPSLIYQNYLRRHILFTDNSATHIKPKYEYKGKGDTGECGMF